MSDLDRMLMRLRAGETDPALSDQVRALLAIDPRLPDELRDPPDLLQDPAEVAEALLAVLGHDDGWLSDLLGGALRAEAEIQVPSAPGVPSAELSGPELEQALLADEAAVVLPLAEAVRAEAGDVAISVAADPLPPIVEAVRASAGTVDLGVEVLVRLGLLPVPVGRAVAVEAGEADVSAAIVGASPPVAEAVRDEAGDAASVIDQVLIANDLAPVAAAVRALAGTIDLADAVIEQTSLPVAQAVATEAGPVDLVASVLGASQLPVAVALAFEAGSIEVAATVAPLDLPVADAIRAEAGAVDLADAVCAAVRRSALTPSPIPEPAAANAGRFWGWAGIALAAVAMLVILVGRFAPLGGPGAALGLIDLPDFAMLDEVRVEDLSHGERAKAAVIPFEDDAGNGVLVIWVEEETDV